MTLTLLTEHIKVQLQENLGSSTKVITEAPGRQSHKKLLTWLVIDDIWPEAATGFGDKAQQLSISILSLCHKKQDKPLVESANQASQLVSIVTNTNWQLPGQCERTTLVRSERDDFQPELPDYFCYRTSFQQVFYPQNN